MMNKTKSTILALVALVVVCGGSFLGVRSLNNSSSKPEPVAPVVVTTASSSATTKGQDLATTAPVIADIETLPVATTKEPETTTEKETTEKESVENETTTEKTVVETTTAISPENITVNPNSSPEQLINDAAVFSEGFLSFIFDPEGAFYFTNGDPWQRNFGFNELYDIAAPFAVFYYDTMRCKFNYENKDWLIQFWKGQYGFVFIGAEIGVYNKPETREENHYDCASDEDCLYMSMTAYRKGVEMFTRDYAKYWWCTGFVPGKLDKFSDRSELSMKCRITMKDYSMLMNFVGALKENGLVMNQNFTTSGLDVFITW